MSWVIENSRQTLGSFITLLMIANHARSDGTGAWPSLATLAKEARLSERQVRYCLRKLERSGELQTQLGCGPYGTNMYSLPKMRGANIAPRGGQSTTQKGAEGGQWIAPYPSFVKTKERPPLPPTAVGGVAREQFFSWQRETVAVRMGNRKRLPNLDAYAGAQAKYVVAFLNSKGIPARIVGELYEKQDTPEPTQETLR